MSDEKIKKMLDAMKVVSQDSLFVSGFITLCKEYEARTKGLVYSVRDEVTGPLIDALHDADTVLRKELSDGTVIEFLYRTKIARDFLMSIPDVPDHVWEPQTTKLLLKLSEQARNVIIGGAYFGDHAVLVGKNIRTHGGICHAFEPNSAQCEMLRRNIEINALENVLAHAEGLWSEDNRYLELVGDDSYAGAQEKTSGELGIQTVSVDAFCKRESMAKLDLLMLDIEGGELRVLQGAKGVLAQPSGLAPNIVFEIHRHYVDWDAGLDNTEIFKYLSSFGYEMYAVRDFNSNVDMRGRPVELIPSAEVYLEGPPHGFNVLAVKDPTSLHGPFFSICHGVSPKLIWHKDPSLHHPLS